jgi:M6 family metalloprotease-like protein
MKYKVLIFTLVIGLNLFGAYLTDLPYTIIQPDGSVFNCLASGDEFHNWLHDDNNFTIIQHPQSGFYVYAVQDGDNLIPSEYVVGRVDPASVGLLPGVNAKPAGFERRTEEFRQLLADNRTRVSTIGELNNLVIFIRFADQGEFTEPFSMYDNMFNAENQNSMYQYFSEVSAEQLDIYSHSYPIPNGNQIISYQSTNPRGYYLVYNPVTNPIGYQTDQQRTQREHALLQAAVQYVEPQIPVDLDIDNDDDGRVDNICFIIQGGTGAWADLLWPHMWVLYSIDVYIHGVQVWTYNFQLSESLNSSGVGVLCHEMFHSLGSPDLYHYTSNGISPTGTWDLMCSNTNPPQHMTAWMKYKYGLWFDNVPEITTAGTYTLQPLADSPFSCYKIASPNSTYEFFMVEYRRRTGIFEPSLPGDGLIIYRIDTRENGNASGPPDEVYVFRPDGTTTSNGSINNANFSADSGRTMFHDNTNPACFLQWGEPGGIFISDVGYVGDTIEFTFNTGIVSMFSSNIQSGPPSLGVQFHNDSYANTTIELFMWDFDGDGLYDSFEENPYHLYEEPGTYDVTLSILSGTDMSTSTIENFITVTETSSISGDVAGIWTEANSPYVIEDNVYIRPSSSLAIEAGTEIIANNNAQIVVFGMLQAIGQQDNPISFSTDDTWKGIRISGTNVENIISNCFISGSSFSAVLVDTNSRIDILNNTFFENSSNALGAAIEVNTGSDIRIIGNLIANNSAVSGSGGIQCISANPLISNNIIVNNTAGIAGVLSLKNDSQPLIINNTIANNDVSGSVVFVFNSNPDIMNSIILNDGDLFQLINSTIDVTYSCLSSEVAGSGNILADPLFSDPTAGSGISFNALSSDWTLQAGSPAIDAGNPDPAYYDPDGSRNDMGAYGGPNSLATTGLNDQELLPSIRNVLNSFPNPFNPTTTILFDLHSNQSEYIEIAIYNLKGQRVKTLLNSTALGFSNSVIWNGTDQNNQSVASGVYFIRLKAGSVNLNKKILMLK